MIDVSFHEVFGVKLPLIKGGFSHLMERAIRSGGYERTEATILSQTLRHDDIVMEVGSGIGFLSTLSAKIATSGRVYAFEANPALIPVSYMTYGLNKVVVILENAVLSREDGQIDFFVHDDFWASSLHNIPNTRKTNVRTLSTANIMAEIRPTYIVIDIEGGECDLVDNIDFSSARELLIELHPSIVGHNAIGRVRNSLAEAGFVETTLSSKSVAHFAR